MILNKVDFDNQIKKAKSELLSNPKFKFNKVNKWCDSLEPLPGIYGIFIDNELKYIGETANFKARMRELHRTYNHSFRKKLGRSLNANLIKNTYHPEVERELDIIFEKSVSVSFVHINYGRLEIETKLVSELQSELFNSIKKRK
jgi:hypothetical protein